MGIPWKATPDELAAKAKAEHAAGRQRFMTRVELEGDRKVYYSEQWSASVEAVESAGWALEHFTVTKSVGVLGEAYFLFKRQ
jgi:hypothetical protein